MDISPSEIPPPFSDRSRRLQWILRAEARGNDLHVDRDAGVVKVLMESPEGKFYAIGHVCLIFFERLKSSGDIETAHRVLNRVKFSWLQPPLDGSCEHDWSATQRHTLHGCYTFGSRSCRLCGVEQRARLDRVSGEEISDWHYHEP